MLVFCLIFLLSSFFLSSRCLHQTCFFCSAIFETKFVVFVSNESASSFFFSLTLFELQNRYAILDDRFGDVVWVKLLLVFDVLSLILCDRLLLSLIDLSF